MSSYGNFNALGQGILQGVQLGMGIDDMKRQRQRQIQQDELHGLQVQNYKDDIAYRNDARDRDTQNRNLAGVYHLFKGGNQDAALSLAERTGLTPDSLPSLYSAKTKFKNLKTSLDQSMETGDFSEPLKYFNETYAPEIQKGLTDDEVKAGYYKQVTGVTGAPDERFALTVTVFDKNGKPVRQGAMSPNRQAHESMVSTFSMDDIMGRIYDDSNAISEIEAKILMNGGQLPSMSEEERLQLAEKYQINAENRQFKRSSALNQQNFENQKALQSQRYAQQKALKSGQNANRYIPKTLTFTDELGNKTQVPAMFDRVDGVWLDAQGNPLQQGLVTQQGSGGPDAAIMQSFAEQYAESMVDEMASLWNSDSTDFKNFGGSKDAAQEHFKRQFLQDPSIQQQYFKDKGIQPFQAASENNKGLKTEQGQQEKPRYMDGGIVANNLINLYAGKITPAQFDEIVKLYNLSDAQQTVIRRHFDQFQKDGNQDRFVQNVSNIVNGNFDSEQFVKMEPVKKMLKENKALGSPSTYNQLNDKHGAIFRFLASPNKNTGELVKQMQDMGFNQNRINYVVSVLLPAYREAKFDDDTLNQYISKIVQDTAREGGFNKLGGM